MKINNRRKVKFLLDSGATCNVMSVSTLKKGMNLRNISDAKLEKSSVTLRIYNGTTITPIGRI